MTGSVVLSHTSTDDETRWFARVNHGDRRSVGHLAGVAVDRREGHGHLLSLR